ncbi:MAG TPA: hypothetical protein VNH11_01155 [Pirellulales bacterium]|nr:hypothetical protein [Pirellulales bacterium]
MRFAISACFALALAAGNTGCCLFCHPMFPCLHRHCNNECGDMGCQRAPIFNWSHCCDTCDHCGDWTGQSIIARTGGNSPQGQYVANDRSRAVRPASRVVPGSYREVTTVPPPGDEAEEDMVDEGPALVAEAPRVRRVRSKSRPRPQVRMQEDE